MSYQKTTEAINKITEVNSWQTLLVAYNHKKHPNEYTCHSFNFADEEQLIQTVQDMCKSFLKRVNDFENKIQPYSGLNPSNVVDKLNTNDDLVKESWISLIRSISVYDDVTPLKGIKANAFIFAGTYKDGETDKTLYFISRKNPILNFKKGRSQIFCARTNTVMVATEPLVQFGKCFDAIVYEDVIYMINDNCESIFNLEHSRKKICKSHLDEIAEKDIIVDMDTYSKYALSGQTPRKFITFNDDIFQNVCSERGRTFLASKFNIPYEEESKQFDLSDPVNAKNFTSIICGKTKQELLYEEFCEVPSSTPLTISK